MIKIAIPLSEGRFSSHFGGADAFAILEVEPSAKTILKSEVRAAPPHEQGAFPTWLKDQQANVILAGGMGPRAVQMLEGYGIEVVTGVSGGAPDEIVNAFLSGTLSTSGAQCSGGHLHACGDHGHE
jgi:ATP-binding protein involved in chromosome partitioning